MWVLGVKHFWRFHPKKKGAKGKRQCTLKWRPGLYELSRLWSNAVRQGEHIDIEMEIGGFVGVCG